MGFQFSRKSRANLVGVHPDLVSVVVRALKYSQQDFSVFEGVRTRERQKKYVDSGVSKTMNSRHIPQSNQCGMGCAVDLVPFIDGGLRWEWIPIYSIARAMRQASLESNVPIVWGGVWDRQLSQLSDDLESEVKAYQVRHPGPDFLDGPHFELAKKEYP